MEILAKKEEPLPTSKDTVLILHGSGGVDGRGAFYAKALQEAGIATLEITMFQPHGRPREGQKANMPHVGLRHLTGWLCSPPLTASGWEQWAFPGAA
jgi:hypothetical protein